MKYGRKPRIHDPRVPKMSMVRISMPAVPTSIDYTAKLPANLGMMLNDQLGDCVEAAAGHATQVWSENAEGTMVTPSNAAVEQFYEVAGGYVPGNPSTDNGTVIQVALADWLKQPFASYRLAAFVEVDQLTPENIKTTIFECGLLYVGFNVPAFLEELENAGAVWDVDPSADNSIIGGHCVCLAGYDPSGNMTVISWGARYTMTPAFFAQFVDEAYALASPEWIGKTSQTPGGMTLAQLEALMSGFGPSPAPPLTPGVRRHRHHRRKMKRQRAQAQLKEGKDTVIVDEVHHWWRRHNEFEAALEPGKFEVLPPPKVT